MPATADDDLQAQLEALRAENESLRAQTAVVADGTAPAARKAGRWRAVVSALCIVIAAILVPVSIVGAWARVQLVDEDAFVNTLAPLVDDPAVQDLIIDETMAGITAQVDFDQLTANVFDGIADLGLPPRAVQALGLLQAPAADGLENLVNQTVTRVVESDAFSDVWATATRAAHRALTTAATSDGGGLVVKTDDGVGIQLGAVVERVKQNLVDRGLGVAQLIPTIDKVIIIGEGNNLAAIRTGYAIAATMGLWLPVITLALFGLGILIARRRSTAILGTGLALAIGSATLAASLSIGSTAVGIVAGDLDLSPTALDVIYQQLVGAMTQTALVTMLLGVLVAVIGWLMGGSRPALGVRSATEGVNASARRQLAERGLDTGAFGTWIGRHRVLVRTGIAVLAVLWLFAMRPLSIGDILLVLVVALLVGWILELLQRRDDEVVVTDAEPTAVATDAEEAGADTLVIADTVVVEDADATDTEVLVGADTADAATTPAAASAAKKTPKR
ncbi:hypothetical protein SAMN04487846_1507 [Microbacterium sp. cf046]|uniref:hypothetical protein n=1 Tax=Microbacterium sp. cf046 TaxID=1761803 RepID=UPI0008E91105|nr:hypothetical protein [Microbacterium sp. cf046]SFS01770.1 hypothetical protein SAMN04487846_1507 [Microbacterium sp. cf046]